MISCDCGLPAGSYGNNEGWLHVTKPPQPWGAHRSRHPDRQAQSLKARFQQVTRLIEKDKRRGAYRWILTTVAFAVGVGAVYLALEASSQWPALTTLKHLLAAPNCTAARAVGLAPAYRGNPGYWAKHDADNDGIACEPWPRSRSPYSRYRRSIR